MNARIRMLLWLVLWAAALNALVAVFAAQWATNPPSSMSWAMERAVQKILREKNDQPPYWPAFRIDGWGVSIVAVNPTSAAERRADSEYIDVSLQAGWPFRWLKSRTVFGPQGWTDPSPAPIALVSRSNARGVMFTPELPTQPMWAAAIANIVIYAAILWVMVMGPLMLRRTMRIRRGQCGQCGYPVGSSPVCTECGMPVKLRTK